MPAGPAPIYLTAAASRRRSQRRQRLGLLALTAILMIPIAASSRSSGATVTSDIPVAGARQAGGPVTLVQPVSNPVFARFGDLKLHLPADETLLLGFHEASQPEALELKPVGVLLENNNATRFDPPKDVVGGPGYLVLSSRGRSQGATTAVDMVLRDDQPVHSPVDGVVTEVRDYYLYGKYLDTRIEVRPSDDPDLRVVMIHVTGVRVRAGDELVAGTTVLADGPNRFPFSSQIDRYFEPDHWPHVHLEVKYPS